MRKSDGGKTAPYSSWLLQTYLARKAENDSDSQTLYCFIKCIGMKSPHKTQKECTASPSLKTGTFIVVVNAVKKP